MLAIFRIGYLRRTLVATALLLLTDPLAAQPEIEPKEEVPQPHRIEDLMRQVTALEDSEPLHAAELFDLAWQLAVKGEDPFIEVKTRELNPLNPGEHRVDAGSRARLQRQFAGASPAFRKAYQEHVAPAAEKALARIAEADVRELDGFILRYQFASAGQTALETLVGLHLSRGEYLQAALQFGRLLNLRNDRSVQNTLQLAVFWWNAELPEEAESILHDVIQEHAGSEVTIGSRTIRLPNTRAEIPDWLDSTARDIDRLAARPQRTDWTQPLGNYRRSLTQKVGPAVLNPAWQVSSFECAWNRDLDILLTPLAKQIQQDALSELRRNNAMAPAATPLVAGNLIVFRGVANIRAVDRKTGELVWESSFVDKQLRDALSAVYRNGQNVAENLESVQSVLRSSLLNHLVRANCGGQLTCAGQIVFAVEEVTAETMDTDWDVQSVGSGLPVNYLRAHDLKTGQSLGFLGGPVGLSAGDLAPNPLKGFYILGTPLVMGERIYVMAERDQGIFLLQLDAGQLDQTEPPFSLRPVHSQLLSQPRHALKDHPVRKFSGVTPSFGRGLLICNTCDEKIVAVSAEDHSIRWVFRYPTNVSVAELGQDIAVLGNANGRQASAQVDLATRWQDALPRVVADRVIVTPRDSDVLVCLELRTGRQIWSRPRGNLRRIAHTDKERVVLTGTDAVTCLNIHDGRVLWQSRIDEGFICGRPAGNGNVLHVPISTPAILSIDLDTGRKLINQAVSGGLPGNLLSTGDRIYSQSLTSVRCFQPSPSDSKTDLEIASQQLLDGKIADAETLLRDLVSTDSDADRETQRLARRLLIQTTLESLRMDFRGSEARIPEVRQLIRDNSMSDENIVRLTQSFLGMTPRDIAVFPDLWDRINNAQRQHEQLQMLMARHQLRGPPGDATQTAQQITEMLSQTFQTRSGFGRVGSLQLRLARATAGAIRSALQARSENRQQIEEVVNPYLSERLRTAETPSEARWWTDMCLTSGLMQPAISAAFSDSKNSGSNHESLRQVIRLMAIDSSTVPDRPSLTIQLLEHLKESGNQELARTVALRSLAARAAEKLPATDAVSSESVPRNLIVPPDLLSSEVLQKYATTATEWPAPFGSVPRVTASADRSVRPPSAFSNNSLRMAIPVFGQSGGFPNWSFAQKQGSDRIHAYDELGRERWAFEPPMSLWGAGSRYRVRFNRVSENYAVAWGPFLAVKLRHLIYLLDCTAASRNTPPRLLWTVDIFREFTSLSESQQFNPAWQRTTQYSIQPTGLFPMSPLTPYGLAVYSGRRLVLFDLLSGRREWQVDGIPDDCTMTIRDDVLMMISDSSGSVESRNIIDGSVISNTPLPDWWTDASENSNASVRDFDLEPGEQLRWRLKVENGVCLLLRRNQNESAIEHFDLSTGDVVHSLTLPADSVVSNIVDGHIAVLTEGRELQIYHLTTATKVADLEVPPAPKCRYLYLRPAHDQWIVLTDVFATDMDDVNPVGSFMVHINGPLYAVNRKSGDLTWSHDVDHRWLRILNPDQSPFPPTTPLLVLLKKPYRRDAEGRIHGATVQAHIFDTRTGRLLYDDEDLGYGLSYHRLDADGDGNRIHIGFDRRSVLFDYNGDTDPEDATPPDQSSE